MKRNRNLIFMTGGGSAGHIVPNLAIADALKETGIASEYLGRPYGMEHDMVTKEGIVFHKMNSGRLHRDIDPDTLLTPFRIIQGTFQAIGWILKRKPAAIFCKGGFMGLPAGIAGWITGTPVVLHESDLTPGLANKLIAPFAKKTCCSFEDTLQYLPEKKRVYTGTPIRMSLTKGNREEGFKLTGLKEGEKPVLMVVGGSLGALALNQAVEENLDLLLEEFQVIHLYGVDHEGDPAPREGYFPLRYATTEMADLFAVTDLVLSRAGSNAINEFLQMKLPAVLVPLPLSVSRGDQLLNARQFSKQGFSYLLEQEQLNRDSLMSALRHVREHRQQYVEAMSSDHAKNGTRELCNVIMEVMK
ncbi:MAG: UDP-N-acetylglucosamine--N-acetylmuramyl-(pentapeptide) pyrophosphoryl-undecaprenol N-acetylglucosamine transferase [Lachnospiraceae bacterium]|nr:UDP-N-acetylglucosamine--N-acetylmuramyl-(pentapeptide) pyrophosphoryl-undecaprenol N-acetylglucosamine transferase [Lachnospiraceae bacterium]